MYALLVFTLVPASFALRICHHNDFHARYVETNSRDIQCSEEDAANASCFSSIARIKFAMDALVCDLRIHAGDFVQGSVYDVLFGTDIAIDAYNAIGYDLLVLGNHEFNKGPEPIYDTVMQTPNTSWLITNVAFADAPPGFKPYAALESDGICWTSALTPATAMLSNPGPTVTISDITRAVNASLATCSQTDNVIAITHQGYEQDLALCRNITAIDLVIGGHSHTDLAQGMYPTKVQRGDGSVCWVVQAGAYGRYLGALDISFEAGVIAFGGQVYLPLDARVPKDADVTTLVAGYTQRLSSSIRQTVGVVTAPVDGSRQSCRSGECEMGNLVCDAMLAYAGLRQGAVACLQNAGGIRASFEAGEVTVEEVLNVLPFGNVHVVLELPGSEIVRVVELAVALVGGAEGAGSVPQIAGMRVTANFSEAVGERVKEVEIDGRALVPGQRYRIVTNSFLAAGGDGLQLQNVSDVQLSGRPLDVLVAEYLSDNSPYEPVLDGRFANVAST